MRGWFARNLAIINLVLVIFSMLSYVAIMFSLRYWTYRGEVIGEIGGILDYNWFGESVLYHVAKDGYKGQRLYTFWDMPLYMITALLVINFLALNVPGLNEAEPKGLSVLWLAIRNLLLGLMCMAGYIWWTMRFISDKTNTWTPPGGVIDYFFPFDIAVTHVFQGYPESSINTGAFIDLTLWLFFALLISTIYTIRRQLETIAKTS